jgi:hypothetical protein
MLNQVPAEGGFIADSSLPLSLEDASVTLFDEAMGYHRLGWSLIPLKMARKRPAVRWKRYQSARADEGQLRKWFCDDKHNGIAVVFGEVSGGLASRDFDDMDAYAQWADSHPSLARRLPTVATARGRHVYCRAEPGSVAAVRRALGKPDGTGAIPCGDGELRAGPGCYSAVPPSVHPSGVRYDWTLPVEDGLPVIDLEAAGFLRQFTHATESNREHGDNRGQQKSTEAIGEEREFLG